jgi:hypothetical protein
VGQYTKYPLSIDTTTELPISTDLVTPVKSEVTNRLREAIVAIEAELGIDPSGTFGTVKARLDALEGMVKSDYADLLARIQHLQDEIDALPTGGGGITAARIRVYRGSVQTAAAPTTNVTVIWSGGVSGLLTALNGTLSGGQTTLSVTQAGSFQIAGQLTLSPSVDAVSSITIEVLQDGVVVETINDGNLVWGIGLTKTFQFRSMLDLTASNQITIRWRHGGSVASATQLSAADNNSWVSCVRIN